MDTSGGGRGLVNESEPLVVESCFLTRLSRLLPMDQVLMEIPSEGDDAIICYRFLSTGTVSPFPSSDKLYGDVCSLSRIACALGGLEQKKALDPRIKPHGGCVQCFPSMCKRLVDVFPTRPRIVYISIGKSTFDGEAKRSSCVAQARFRLFEKGVSFFCSFSGVFGYHPHSFGYQASNGIVCAYFCVRYLRKA